MNAELMKLRYLPTARWTAAFVAAVVLIVGLVLLAVAPSNPDKYVSIPNTTIGLVTSIAAMVFGVWLATLEFGAGTLQRTLTAEPDRKRVLTNKLLLTIAVVAFGGGIAVSLVFVLAFDGIVSFIPGAQDYTYGQLSADLANGISGTGETQSGLAVALIGVIVWCGCILTPGWVRFLRGDLK